MKKIILASLFFFAGQTFAGKGGDVGNGGDVITCYQSSENPFNGTYVLDYVVNYDGWTESIDQDPNPVETIWKSLRAKSKGNDGFGWMAESLLKFFQSAQQQLYRGPDFKSSIIWMPQPFGLIDLQDEALVQAVPQNCKFRENDQWKPDLRQVVVQEQKPGSVILRYDGSTIKRLSPMQFSYLMIHEWLRGALLNTGELRDINKLFHSKVFIEASATDGASMIYNLIGKQFIYGPLKLDQNRYTIRFADVETKVLKVFPGSSMLLGIVFPPLDNLQCVVKENGDPDPKSIEFDECSTEANLQDGSSIWISYNLRTPSGDLGKVVIKKLIQAQSEAPDFTLPKP